MLQILVVEDSPIVQKIIRHVVGQNDNITAVYAATLEDTRKLLKAGAEQYFAALVDLSLPDAPDGEVVDAVLEAGVPSIVLTGTFDPEKRSKLLEKGVVDYVTKEGRFSYEYALGIVERLDKNRGIKVLVADDSATSRNVIVNLLELQLFQVFDAEDGVEAIRTFLQHPDIKLIITDYNMPRMNGCELVQHMRRRYDKSDLILIGLSSETEGTLSAKFIKNGANDFLRKPFCHEEFFCRINHNIEFMEVVEKLKDSSSRDEYTGAFKMSYFESHGQTLFEKARSAGSPVACALIDLSDVSEISDEHGPEAGDIVMQQVSAFLVESFDRFLLARAGNTQFVALLAGLTNDKAVAFCERVRQVLGGRFIDLGNREVSVSFSGGVASAGTTLEELVSGAKQALDRSLDAGGDLIIGAIGEN